MWQRLKWWWWFIHTPNRIRFLSLDSWQVALRSWEALEPEGRPAWANRPPRRMPFDVGDAVVLDVGVNWYSDPMGSLIDSPLDSGRVLLTAQCSGWLMVPPDAHVRTQLKWQQTRERVDETDYEGSA